MVPGVPTALVSGGFAKVFEADYHYGAMSNRDAAKRSKDGIQGAIDHYHIEDIFSPEDDGLVYDGQAKGSMYQEQKGETLSLEGDPIALLLDRRYGLGRHQPNLIENAASEWTLSTGWEQDDVVITYTGDQPGNVIQLPLPDIVNGRYLLTFDVEFFEQADSAPMINVRLGQTSNVSQRVSIPEPPRGGGYSRSYRFVLTGEAPYLELNPNRYVTSVPAFTGHISNIALRELPGVHIEQADNAARPSISNGAISTDGVDDCLEGTPFIDPNSFTCVFSVTPRLSGTDDPLFDLTTGQNSGRFYHNDSNGQWMRWRHSSNNYQESVGQNHVNEWFIGAVCCYENIVYFYRNGVLTNTRELVEHDYNPGGFILLAARAGYQYTKSSLNQIVFREGKLSDEELQRVSQWMAAKAGKTL